MLSEEERAAVGRATEALVEEREARSRLEAVTQESIEVRSRLKAANERGNTAPPKSPSSHQWVSPPRHKCADHEREAARARRAMLLYTKLRSFNASFQQDPAGSSSS